MVAEKSNQHQSAIQKYLKMNHYSDLVSNPSNGLGSQNVSNIVHNSANFSTNIASTKESRNNIKFDKMLESHLENMVSIVIRESGLDSKKW